MAIGDPGSLVTLSAKTRQVRPLITSVPGPRAHLHRLCAGSPDLDAEVLLLDSRRPHRPVAPAEFDSHWPPQIIGEKASRIYFLDVRNVEYLASAGNYVTTHLAGEQFLTRATLKSMAELLSPLGFIQIERSLIVNLRQVAHVERRDRGQYCFVTRHGDRLVSSRERGGTLHSLLLAPTTPLRR